jgi:hypothetical protein
MAKSKEQKRKEAHDRNLVGYRRDYMRYAFPGWLASWRHAGDGLHEAVYLATRARELHAKALEAQVSMSGQPLDDSAWELARLRKPESFIRHVMCASNRQILVNSYHLECYKQGIINLQQYQSVVQEENPNGQDQTAKTTGSVAA